MDHKAARQRLGEYLDGAGTGEERNAIEAHLETCARCREALADLRATIDRIRSLEAVEPPPWMTQRIMARVREIAEGRRGLGALFSRMFPGTLLRPALSAAAIACVALLAWHIFQQVHPEMAPRPKGAEVQTIPRETTSAAHTEDALKPKARAEVEHAEGRATPPPPPAPKKAPAPGAAPIRPAAPLAEAPPLPSDIDEGKEEATKVLLEKKAVPETLPAAQSAAPRLLSKDAATPVTGIGASVDAAKMKSFAAPAEEKAVAGRGPLAISVRAKDPQAARADVERLVARQGGRLLASRRSGSAWIVEAEVPARRAAALQADLRSVGEVKGTFPLSDKDEEAVRVVIKIAAE